MMKSSRVWIPGVVSLFLALGASAWAGPRVQLVSDIDDTIKITNVQDKSEAARNGLSSKKAFAGMAALYRAWRESAAVETQEPVYLSSSPTFLRDRLRDFLSENGFPAGVLQLRSWVSDGLTGPQYKHREMKRLGERLDSRGWLLVGDDTQDDPAVYERFAREQAPKHDVLATYIRDVRVLAPLAGQMTFRTAFDVAALEWMAGRLTEAAALDVGRATLEADEELFQPRFVRCRADEPGAIPFTPDLAVVAEAIEARWARLCARTRAAIEPEAVPAL
jgi:phosphatidate phosphatase APP1